MISKVKALIKVSLEQTKIDELKEDLESKLNLLNVKEEELADRASKQFFNNYLRGKEYYPDLLKAFPSVIRSVENAITTDNEKKMKERIQALGELGKEIIEKEITKFNTDYEEGEQNYPALLKKLPDIIEFLKVIRTSDKERIVENKKLYKEMLAKRGKIRRPENSLQESDDVESASLSPIMDELEEQVEERSKKLLDRQGKPMKGDGDKVAKQYAPKGLSPQSRSALGSGLVSANTSGKVLKDKLRRMQEELTPKFNNFINKYYKKEQGNSLANQASGGGLENEGVNLQSLQQSRNAISTEAGLDSSPVSYSVRSSLITDIEAPTIIHQIAQGAIVGNNGHESNRKYTSRSLLPEFEKEGYDKKIGKDERDREERLKMLLTLHNNEEFKKDKQNYLYLLKQLPMFIDEVINDTRNSILSKNEEHNTDKKSSLDFESKMNKRIKSLKELDQDIKLELLMMDQDIKLEPLMMDRSIRMESKKEGNNKDGSEDGSERNAKFPKEVTQQKSESGIRLEVKLGSSPNSYSGKSNLITDREAEAHQNLTVSHQIAQGAIVGNNGHESNRKYTSKSLSPEFQKEGFYKKIEEGEGHSTEHEELMARHKKRQNELEEIIKEQDELKKSLLLEKVVVDIQRAWSEREVKLRDGKPIEAFLKKIEVEYKLGPIKENLTDRYPPAPTPLPKPKPENSCKSPPKANSPKANSPQANSPQALAISTYPRALAAHFNPNLLPEYRQQTMFSVTYYVNPSNQYSHGDVYSQVPRGSVQFIQPPTAISTKTSTLPIQLSPQSNSRFP